MKFNPNAVSLIERGVEARTDELRKSYEESAYNWQPGQGGTLRISKSSLGSHGFCPLKYKFSYIYRLPSEESEAMTRGTNVHSIVEYFWHHVDDVLDEVLTLIEEDKKLLAKDKLRSVIPTPPTPYEFGEQVVIDKWLDWQWDRLLITNGDNWKPTGNEVSAHARMEIEVDGEKIPVHLRGFIDTIFSDGEGGSILMELKTGKWNLKKAKYMREEMQFYRLMLEEGGYANYLPVTHWAWEFPNGTANGGIKAEWEIEELGTRKTSYAPRTVMNNLVKLIRSHLKDEFEPKPFALKCEWCDFMELCPAWGGGMENGQTETEE